jgi:hypothetical protein
MLAACRPTVLSAIEAHFADVDAYAQTLTASQRRGAGELQRAGLIEIEGRRNRRARH